MTYAVLEVEQSLIDEIKALYDRDEFKNSAILRSAYLDTNILKDGVFIGRGTGQILLIPKSKCEHGKTSPHFYDVFAPTQGAQKPSGNFCHGPLLKSS